MECNTLQTLSSKQDIEVLLTQACSDRRLDPSQVNIAGFCLYSVEEFVNLNEEDFALIDSANGRDLFAVLLPYLSTIATEFTSQDLNRYRFPPDQVLSRKNSYAESDDSGFQTDYSTSFNDTEWTDVLCDEWFGRSRQNSGHVFESLPHINPDEADFHNGQSQQYCGEITETLPTVNPEENNFQNSQRQQNYGQILESLPRINPNETDFQQIDDTSTSLNPPTTQIPLTVEEAESSMQTLTTLTNMEPGYDCSSRKVSTKKKSTQRRNSVPYEKPNSPENDDVEDITAKAMAIAGVTFGDVFDDQPYEEKNLPETLFQLHLAGNNGGIPIKQTKRRQRGRKLWEYLLDLLNDQEYNPGIIRWENEDQGIFRLMDKDIIAEKWGLRKKRGAKKYAYEYFARALRYYYKKKPNHPNKLESVRERKLVYKFSPSIMKLRREGSV